MTGETTLSSQFLASPVVGGLASGLATAAFAGKGQSYRSRKRDVRMQYKYQARYLPGITRSIGNVNEEFRNRQIQGRVADAKAAGLHPLAALGIAPGGLGGQGGSAVMSPSPAPGPTGSAVGEGIRTALSMQQSKSAAAHAQKMADLNLAEQGLRNTWLEEQIKHQRWKRLQDMANAAGRGTVDPLLQEAKRRQERLKAGLSSTISLGRDASFKTGATSPASDWQERHGEPGELVGGLINMGYDAVENTVNQSMVDKIIESTLGPGLSTHRQKQEYMMNRLYPPGKFNTRGNSSKYRHKLRRTPRNYRTSPSAAYP